MLTINDKVITKCFKECPYYGLAGDDRRYMCCTHKQAPRAGRIIFHPTCDYGFPEKCPLFAKEKSSAKGYSANARSTSYCG